MNALIQAATAKEAKDRPASLAALLKLKVAKKPAKQSQKQTENTGDKTLIETVGDDKTLIDSTVPPTAAQAPKA